MGLLRPVDVVVVDRGCSRGGNRSSFPLARVVVSRRGIPGTPLSRSVAAKSGIVIS